MSMIPVGTCGIQKYKLERIKKHGDEMLKPIGKSRSVVLRLLHPILDQGYHLYLDNWYSSPARFNQLVL